MYDYYEEANYPITHRQREIECILSALLMRRSVKVAGLSGMGKSNLLRFLVSHPELIESHPEFMEQSVKFLHIDCNKIDPVNAFSFFQECLFLLESTLEQRPTDKYVLHKAVEISLRQLEQDITVIMVIDQVDKLFEKADTALFRQLRNLRDEARARNMMFVLAARRPLPDLFELESLFSDLCWVGPLTEADHLPFFEREQHRLRLQLDHSQKALLHRITGSHAGLLRVSLEWIKREGMDHKVWSEAEMIEGLLNYEPTQRYCQSLWEDLTEVEHQHLVQLNTMEVDLTGLLNSGVIVMKGDQYAIFSPLWQAYLTQKRWLQSDMLPLRIECQPVTRRVAFRWQGRQMGTTISRPLVFNLLQILANQPGETVSKNQMIEMLYPEAKALNVYDDSIFQLVTVLRRTIDPLIKELCPAMTESCIQNVRGIGYKLVVELPDKNN